MIAIKPFLVTSNGERLMRNSSLLSAIVFKKEVIFHEFDFETSDLELEVSKSTIYNFVTRVFSSFIIISQL